MEDEFGDDIDWSAVPNVGGSSTTQQAAAMSTNNNNNYNSTMTNRGGGGALHQQQNIGNMGFDYAEISSQPSLTTNNNNFVAPQPAPAPTNYTSTNNYSSTDTNVLQKQVSKLRLWYIVLL